MGEPSEVRKEDGTIEHKYSIQQVELPKQGMIKNWELFLTFMRNIPNPSGKFKPVKVQEDGYIPVMSYRQLMFGDNDNSNNESTNGTNTPNAISKSKQTKQTRCVLNVYTHGVPPYKPKNSFLFVSNYNKTKLFVIYDTCLVSHRSLVKDASYYENNNQSFIQFSHVFLVFFLFLFYFLLCIVNDCGFDI